MKQMVKFLHTGSFWKDVGRVHILLSSYRLVFKSSQPESVQCAELLKRYKTNLIVVL